MGGGGHIGAMNSSMKNNNRRKDRERMKVSEPTTSSTNKLVLNTPEVTDSERKRIVRNIISHRKSNELIAYFVIVGIVVVIAVTIFTSM